MGKVITHDEEIDLIKWSDLTDDEKSNHDWVESSKNKEHLFFRFEGSCYCLSDFPKTKNNPWFGENLPEPYSEWDAFHADSWPNQLLIKHVHGINNHIIVGIYYSKG